MYTNMVSILKPAKIGKFELSNFTIKPEEIEKILIRSIMSYSHSEMYDLADIYQHGDIMIAYDKHSNAVGVEVQVNVNIVMVDIVMVDIVKEILMIVKVFANVVMARVYVQNVRELPNVLNAKEKAMTFMQLKWTVQYH